MANVIKMLLRWRVYADNKRFPKNSWFFSQFHLTKRMILKYVKIYETPQYAKKQIFTLTLLQMYCGLHFQFRRAHYNS
jgi:hypothetical protein